MALAVPPRRDELAGRAIVDQWRAGRRIFRAHSHYFGSGQLDDRADADSRFSTIRCNGDVLPVLYGGEDDYAAASETIFHTVDTPTGNSRPRRVTLEKYLSWHWSSVVASRDLNLVRLAGDGLIELGVTRADLIECGRPHYPRTREWAAALALALPEVDGLWWESRQASDRWATVLFGPLGHRSGGIHPGDLVADTPVLPFALRAGRDRLDAIATNLDITIIRSGPDG